MTELEYVPLGDEFLEKHFPYQYYFQAVTGEMLYQPEPCPYCNTVMSPWKIKCTQCGAPLWN